MPLYIPSPSQGRGLKPHFAQLARLYVVVPDCPAGGYPQPTGTAWSSSLPSFPSRADRFSVAT
ncbi:Protein smg8 [Larimichthys crocea]|uniref:Uncharacterized protein n=1 Tax=Larimichthys crocea TaxID=215358 RepID=A0ACD3R4C4_LARCR|nr:Protein smg8 [Larimichthys crocea]